MNNRHLRKFVWLAALFCGAGATLTGCELKCQTDSDNSVEDVIDEIGDEVEDVTKELKKDK